MDLAKGFDPDFSTTDSVFAGFRSLNTLFFGVCGSRHIPTLSLCYPKSLICG